VNRNINPGEFPGTRQIFTIQATSRVYAVLNGSAGQIAGLQPGATATIASSTLPGKQFTGTVDAILNALTPGSTNFVVKVVLANPAGTLRPGMAVSGSARLPSTHGLMIPDTAFLDTTNGTVQVVSGTTVQTAKVTMLADDGTNAIVTGLAPNAAVVVNGQSGLTDGQSVAPQLVAKAGA
jgi:RND family efflux transporter MFP subunit